MHKWIFSAVFVVGMGALVPQAHADWFKGNTHCHSATSPDSDVPQNALMTWYKTHDYHFVVLTDHNKYTPVEDLNLLADPDGVTLVDENFILIAGEELTTSAHHINGLSIPSQINPSSTISANFEKIWAEGGFPQLNHPEWSYLTARDVIEELAELDGPMFLEVYNSHPGVVERSGPSSEDIWDGVLSTGKSIWGVAVDDAHTLEGGHAPVGGGVIYVQADVLTPEAILSAMQAGRFYASSGATLADFSWTSALYEVDAPGATSIVFFGDGGQVLGRSDGDYGSYTFREGDRYVRARVESPEGFAWTQPVFLDDRPANAPPTAVIKTSDISGEAPFRARFDGRDSSDPDGQIESWRWDFGDGTVGRGEVISHTFEEPGQYTVELIVFDDQVEMSRDSLVVVVRAPDTTEPMTGTSNGTTATSNGTTAATSSTSNETSDSNPNVAAAQASNDDGCSVASTHRDHPSYVWLSVLLGLLVVVGARKR